MAVIRKPYFIQPMKKPLTLPSGFLRWFLLYLWSASLGILLIDIMDLQYDVVGVWWLAMAYGLPLRLFAERFPKGAGLGAIVAGYFAALGVVSASLWRFRRHATL